MRRRLLRAFASSSKVQIALAVVANLAVMPAFGAAPARAVAPGQGQCGQFSVCTVANPMGAVSAALPAGTAPCPSSGAGAACTTGKALAAATPGVASLPSGMGACPTSADKPVPSTAAACGATTVETQLGGTLGPPASPNVSITPLLPQIPAFTVPPPQGLSLTVDRTAVPSGGSVLLTATSSDSVSGTTVAIEIFDRTSGTLVAACGESAQCAVDYSAHSGVHTFTAFITTPTSDLSTATRSITSNTVNVGWLGVSIDASTLVAAPDQAVTVTATSTVDVALSGRRLEIYDLTKQSPVTYCSRGTVCKTSITATPGVVHDFVARVDGSPESVSNSVRLTWLAVKLTATTLTQSNTGTVQLLATVNADLSQTPWVLSIYDEHGRLVGSCASGTSCSATDWFDPSRPTTYTAVVGELASDQTTTAGRIDARKGGIASRFGAAVATSPAVTPSRVLWGVDSCNAFTSDPQGASGLYHAVASMLGAPDFWGRYLTDTWCPGISATEIAAAAYNHMGILPIYNNYDCSAVASYQTGAAYAAAAVAAAENLGIPAGTALAIDIEPPGPQCPGAGNVDSGFVEGWFNGVHDAGYTPVYYGNGTAGSAFASAWCAAVADAPNIVTDSYLWSFEPSLLGRFIKATAPGFVPYAPGCDATMGAWQYQISAGGVPDVDHDLALSSMPLWYP